MNILFDLRLTQILRNSGVERYVEGFLNSILKNKKQHKVFIILDKMYILPNINYDYVEEVLYFQDLKSYSFEQKFDFWFLDDFFFHMKLQNIDNFFDELFPENLRANSKKTVSISYDFAPIIFAKDFLSDPMIKAKTLLEIETSVLIDHFFSISESTKNDGIKFLKRDKSDFTVIYSGISDLFLNATKETYCHNKRSNTLVCISPPADRKKNIIAAVEGFSLAYNKGSIPRDAKLCLCGAYNEAFIQSLNNVNKLKQDTIVLAGFVSDDELVNYVTNAKATIFPSFYEGLGLPILESYAQNTPCFASDATSMKELVHEECRFDPHDYQSIALMIEKIYNNECLCNKSLEFGKKFINEKANWDTVSATVLSTLERLNSQGVE